VRYVVIIPARYKSSRLPGKPLINLCGLPMIVRTYRQCLKSCPSERIYVATDDERVARVCRENAINVLMTSASCRTGTDRVAECAAILAADVFVNVQGDEPVFDPGDLTKFIETIKSYPDEVLSGYCAIEGEHQFRSGTIPKVVMRADERLLYMSRAPIPTTKEHGYVKAWRQVCVYAFPRKALSAFASAGGKSTLEEVEDIEILRFLEIGWEVRMVPLSSKSFSVDIPEDIANVEAIIRDRGL
jgi:3-deoxy-manno-octulosonate cytidylyltransferase (CMP-KDO synthetase)